MPFIDVHVNTTVSPEQEQGLKSALGRAISLIPGKSEGSLMVQVTDGCHLWFGGKQDGTIAFVNVMLYGAASREAYESFSAQAIPLIQQELGAKTVYLKFEEVENWFWN